MSGRETQPSVPVAAFVESDAQNGAGSAKARPARRSPGDPSTDPARDYVTLCISTYPNDLARWDAEVERRKAAGDRRASRSSVIREAMAQLIARGR